MLSTTAGSQLCRGSRPERIDVTRLALGGFASLQAATLWLSALQASHGFRDGHEGHLTGTRMLAAITAMYVIDLRMIDIARQGFVLTG